MSDGTTKVATTPAVSPTKEMLVGWVEKGVKPAAAEILDPSQVGIKIALWAGGQPKEDFLSLWQRRGRVSSE